MKIKQCNKRKIYQNHKSNLRKLIMSPNGQWKTCLWFIFFLHIQPKCLWKSMGYDRGNINTKKMSIIVLEINSLIKQILYNKILSNWLPKKKNVFPIQNKTLDIIFICSKNLYNHGVNPFVYDIIFILFFEFHV